MPLAVVTIDQAKAAYVRGDIDAEQLEQRVSDVLDGTEAKRHAEQMARHCAAHGHTWIQRVQDIDPLKCGMCGTPWTKEEN